MGPLIVHRSQHTLWQMMSASPKELGSTKPEIYCQILHMFDYLEMEMLAVVLVLRVPAGSGGLVVDPLCRRPWNDVPLRLRVSDLLVMVPLRGR